LLLGCLVKINWVDIVIVIYIAWSFSIGKKRGLSGEGLALVTALFSLVLSLHFYQGTGDSLHRWFLLSVPSADTIAYTAIAVLIILLGVLLGSFFKKIMKLSFLPNIEKIGGCICGTLRGILISAVIIVGLAISPAAFMQEEVYINSFLGNYLVALSPKIHGWVLSNGPQSSASFDQGKFLSQLPERPKKEIL